MLTDNLLWDYADGFLSAEEKLRIDEYLRQHPEQKPRLEAVIAEKQAFASLSLEQPDAGFSKKIMAAWAAEQAQSAATAAAKPKGRDWILWAIGSTIGLFLFACIALILASEPAAFSLKVPAEYVPSVQLPTLDWAGYASGAILRNALLLVLGVMTLKILDKYLQVRRLQLAE